MRTRANILGVLIDQVDLPQVETMVNDFVSSGKPHQIVTVNLDFITWSLRDPNFSELINSSSLAVADGMPVLWASKMLGFPIPQRITGMDIVHTCCRLANRKGQRVFLLGAEPGVASRAGEALCQTYPNIRIAGTYSPPFVDLTPEVNKRIVDMVVASEPHYLFVAFGSPKQEFWIRKNFSSLGVPVCVGIGGVFNFLAGRVRRAPEWMQSLGFEWAFRMTQQPWLARRYFIDDLPTFFRMIGSKHSAMERGNVGVHQNANRVFHNSPGLKQIGPME